MHLTDQPGRWMAVLVFAPMLLWRGCLHRDPWIVAFAGLLFGWDALWLAFAAPRCLSPPRHHSVQRDA